MDQQRTKHVCFCLNGTLIFFILFYILGLEL